MHSGVGTIRHFENTISGKVDFWAPVFEICPD
jgi:hypothetical protein